MASSRRRPVLLLAGMLIVAAAAANAGTAAGKPVEHYRIPFLTLRDKTGSPDPDTYFGGKRDRLRAGYCEVSGEVSPALKMLADSVPFYVPEDILTLDAVREIPLADFWQAIEQSTAGQAPVLYTHGFYISFDRGCRRAAEFQRRLKLAGRFILFSWPSDGIIVNYTQDEADMYWSVRPLQQVLRAYYRRFGAGRANLVAHSLGSRGVLLALVRLAGERKATAPLFNQLVFIAPDIDAGIFRQYLPVIKPLAANITVYVSAHDSPLALSEQVHGYPRLGQAGAHLDGLDGIDIIDISDVPQVSPTGHLYHLYNDYVIADLDRLLNQNLVASRRTGLVRGAHHRWHLQAPPATTAGAGIK